MVRPVKNRKVGFNPRACYFKPRGIPLVDLEEVTLTVDELEALRLADLLGLSQDEAGQRMGVSRATFGRIVARARRTVAEALVQGKAVLVEGGSYEMVEPGPRRTFVCLACEAGWTEPLGTGRPEACPQCGGQEFMRPGRGRRRNEPAP